VKAQVVVRVVNAALALAVAVAAVADEAVADEVELVVYVVYKVLFSQIVLTNRQGYGRDW
jgi:hypothetical protein